MCVGTRAQHKVIFSARARHEIAAKFFFVSLVSRVQRAEWSFADHVKATIKKWQAANEAFVAGNIAEAITQFKVLFFFRSLSLLSLVSLLHHRATHMYTVT
jgi:hypothetical protein